jgi:thiol-disulfide isomerase/thioredoxin
MDSKEKTSREVEIRIDRRVLAGGGFVIAILVMLVIGTFVGQQLAAKQATVAPGSIVNQPAQAQSLDQSAAVQLDQLAPDFTLTDLEGKTVRLSDFQGKPVIINFWATWCAPCRLEMPALEAIYQKYKDKGLIVLGVNTGERVRDQGLTERVKTHAQQLGINFPVLLDTTDSVANLYRLRAYPTSYFIDSSGKVTDMRRGAFAGQADIEPYLAKILQ